MDVVGLWITQISALLTSFWTTIIICKHSTNGIGGHGCNRMVVGFTTTILANILWIEFLRQFG